MEKCYIVCYDIVDDKRRRKVYELLKDHGQRVQYSVFECLLDKKTMVRLKYKLRQMIEGEDSIIVYPLCANCQDDISFMGRYFGLLNDEETFIL